LLRARRERPRRRTAKQRDKLAPFHSITSHPRPRFGIILTDSNQYADAPLPLGLLRPRRERSRGRRTAEQRDELAALDESCHLIPPAGRVTAQR
ncbi:MAG TPA: hypothetical protein VF022_10530, partial [Rhodanobacteraceae bacterium]